jgi:hypothetical protein
MGGSELGLFGHLVFKSLCRHELFGALDRLAHRRDP